MKIMQSDRLHKDVISDHGVQNKVDSFSLVVSGISHVITLILLILAVLIFLNS